mgnify:FL=1
MCSSDLCRFIGPEDSGMLACGYEGAGRLVAVDAILEEVDTFAKDGD